MRTRLRRMLNRAVALPLIAALPAWAIPLQDPFAGLMAVKDDRLDEMRGGFENSQGFQFSFAIERAIVVNGELIASTRLVLTDLAALLAGGVTNIDVISSARSIVQSGIGNTVAPAAAAAPALSPAAAASAPGPAAAAATTVPAATVPATQGAAPSTAAAVPAPAVAAAAAPAPAPVVAPPPAAVAASPAPVVAPPPSTVAAAPAPAPLPAIAPAATPAAAAAPLPATAAPAAVGPILIQTTAAGHTIVIPNASAIVSAVQNTVNNQIIQTRTTIDAALSSIAALRANTLTQAIQQQALDGVRRP